MLNTLVENFLATWKRPRWRWALAIAVVSDALGFALIVFPLGVWLLDALTAAGLLITLGFGWPLLAALAIEVIPAVQVFPFWTLAVLAMSAATTQGSPEVRLTDAGTGAGEPDMVSARRIDTLGATQEERK